MIKKLIALSTAILTFAGLAIHTDKGEADKLSINVEPPTFAHSESLPEVRYTGAFYSLSYDEYNAVCRAVMAEAGGEPYKGQQAVAQCLLNACRMEGKNPLQIIEEYQYSRKDIAPTDSVRCAVLSIFTYGEKVLPEDTLYFYAPKLGCSIWHESKVYVTTIGGHRFFAES